MRLFQAIEKCFPEMRKHKDWLFAQKPKDYWSEDRLYELKDQMCQWIMDEYLDEQTCIYQLFLQAGVTSRHSMAAQMLVWHIYDWNIEHKSAQLSRTDTSPVPPLEHQC